jgi:DNA-directed RNA polymerase specialized sigma24 family protein
MAWMTEDEYNQFVVRYRLSIQGIARRIAGRNDELCDELIQVGRIALWKFDPTKATSNLDGLVKRHLRNRMIDFIRSTYNKYDGESLYDSDVDHFDLWVDGSGMAQLRNLTAYDRSTPGSPEFDD